MPRIFLKTIKCGCIVKSISIGKNKNNMHMIGGHKHYNICEKCKKKEKVEDTLYEMFENDNFTDGLGNDGWNEKT
jgi:hypothetical protein